MKNKSWLNISLFQFVLIAIIGLMIRLIFTGQDVGFPYKNLVHAHSHVGFLGWISMAIYVALIAQFKPDSSHDKAYQRIFILTEISIIGMLISFPIQGYALYSISFSTLFLIASYWFVAKFYNLVKKYPAELISVKFAKAGLFYLVLSSFGPWALGPTMATGHGKDNIYFLIIFFYLHFLYNGAIIMALFAMIFKYLEDQGLAPKKLAINGRRVFFLTNLAVIPTYALSTLWATPDVWVYWLGGIFAVVQVVAFWYFLPFGKILLQSLIKKNSWAFRLIVLSAAAFVIKLIFQLLSSFPFFVDDVNLLKSTVVMGYLHLVTLGIISFFLIGWFLFLGGFSSRTILAKAGLAIFVLGVFLTESYLFGHGLNIWLGGTVQNYAVQLAWVSSLLPVGLGLFWLAQVLQSPKTKGH